MRRSLPWITPENRDAASRDALSRLASWRNAEGLDDWLTDAHASGIYAMQRFARTIRQDIEAVRNAMSEPWSHGQTEGQINKLKALKRAMYGRAGVELLRARMMPL